MIGSFDKYSNYEVPAVTLCNPSATAIINENGGVRITNSIGLLTDPKGSHLKLNFNAPHEISFDYERHISQDPIEQAFYNDIYDSIVTDRYLFLETVGFYIITAVTDSDEDGIEKKSITAQSCEREHENFEGINIEEDKAYYLHTDNDDGLIDLYIKNCPHWTVKYVDPVLIAKDGKTRVYTFEKTDAEDGYKFLYETLQDGCECIVEPDILTRELSFYSREAYAQNHKTDIHVAKYNLLKHRVIEETDEDKWTALNVLGKDEDLRISMVNPTGMNTLYNFTYRYAWMSPELQEALDKWQAKIDSVEDEYYELVSGYAPQRDNLWNKAEDIKVLETELKVLNSSRDAIISSTEDAEVKDKDGKVIKEAGQTKDDALKEINNLISAKETEIATAKSEYSTLEIQIEEEYEEAISDINSACRLGLTTTDIDGNLIFTEELLEELAPHIKATDYNDEYLGITENMTWVQKYEIAKQLYDRAKSQMVKLSSGKKTYKFDTESFLFNEAFKYFSEQLVAGAIINCETKEDVVEELHLTGIDINFDERKTDFTLGNKYDRSDLKSLYEDTLGSHSKAASDLKYLKSIVEEQQRFINYDWANELRTLTLDHVLSSANQEVMINDRGYWGRQIATDEYGNYVVNEFGSYEYSPEQIKIINNGIYITNDNWNSLKVAIGYMMLPNGAMGYGINTEVLIGKLLLGESLILQGGSRFVSEDEDGNEVEGYTITLDYRGLIITNIDTEGGITIQDENGNKQFYTDSNGNVRLAGYIMPPTGLSEEVYIGVGKPVLSDESGMIDAYGLSIYSTNDINRFPNDGKSHEGVVLDDTNSSLAPFFTIFQDNSINVDSNKYYTNIISTQDIAFIIAPLENSLEDSSSTSYSDTPLTLTIDGGLMSGNWDFVKDQFFTKLIGSSIAFVLEKNDIRYASFYTVGDNHEPCLKSDQGTDLRISVGGDTRLKCTSNGGTLFGAWDFGQDQYFNRRIGSSVGFVLGDSIDNCGSIYRNNNIMQFYLDSGEYINFYTGYNNILSLGRNRVDVRNTFSVYNNQGIPRLVAEYNGGDLYGAWYLNDSSISTSSDRNVKNSIYSLDSRYSELFDLLQPIKYKYNEGTSDRFHIGFISQDVGEAIEQAGLTSQDFAGFVKEITDDGEEKYYLRYEEFIALCVKEIQTLKAKVAQLESAQ